MPSFQSPVPMSGRPWLPTLEAAVQGARAMLEKSGASFRDARLEIGFLLAFRQRIALDERDRFFEHGHVAGGFDELDARRRAARADRLTCACECRGPKADATSVARLLPEIGALRRAIIVRAPRRVWRHSAPSRLAVDRGIRRRRSPGRNRRAPKYGRKASDRAASDSAAHPCWDRE